MGEVIQFQETPMAKYDHYAISQIHDYDLDYQSREIYLVGREDYLTAMDEGNVEPGVDFAMANRFIKNLNLLQNSSSDPILLNLKSCGGDWLEGIAIYQAILACPCHVTILNYASARSMSSIIFLAGDKRVMMPYSQYMFHMGTEGFEGTGTQYETEYEQFQLTKRQMLDIYVEKLRESEPFRGESDGKIRQWLTRKMRAKEEVYLTAEEAVEYNFADEIFDLDWSKLKKPA